MAKTPIYEQQQALSVYFRDMLAEPTVRSAPAVKTAAAATSAEMLQAEQPGHEQMDAPLRTDSATSTPSSAQTPTVSKPAEAPIKLLLCEIGEMKLALPVAALNNIIRWPQQGLRQLPGQPSWQLGLLSQAEQNTGVIDLCRLLKVKAAPAISAPRYILLIDERRWAIACDRIGQILSYDSAAINWRQNRAERPWFTGVISDNMHSILDLDATLEAIRN